MWMAHAGGTHGIPWASPFPSVIVCGAWMDAGATLTARAHAAPAPPWPRPRAAPRCAAPACRPPANYSPAPRPAPRELSRLPQNTTQPFASSRHRYATVRFARSFALHPNAVEHTLRHVRRTARDLEPQRSGGIARHAPSQLPRTRGGAEVHTPRPSRPPRRPQPPIRLILAIPSATSQFVAHWDS